jgi:hypothetical protein
MEFHSAYIQRTYVQQRKWSAIRGSAMQKDSLVGGKDSKRPSDKTWIHRLKIAGFRDSF